ncbi:MAG: glutamate--tRNA ligase [Clostridiales bacterium]|nr:MAG: glutamate--tRNA ligase [Clostridiales bacterium]
MDYNKLANLLFPHITQTPEDIEAKYPARDLPEGAKVTRFAPSPTGFVHFGGMYQVMIDERLAHQSGGIFYLRIEDTDSRREISDAAQSLIKTLGSFGINFDEGAAIDENGNIYDKGLYGPYKQSQRADIYHVYAKKLVTEGKAYPVFSSEEELEAVLAVDKKEENKTKNWEEEAAKQKEEMLKNREFTIEDVESELKSGHKFVLRLLADGDPDKKIPFTDLVKGKLEIPENDEDFVLLKSDGIPTYHFAHAVDDHLMGTTNVIRGEEWLPSVAKHIMLFRYLGFRMPKYIHTAQIMRTDENGNKKKLSKRDMGANMEDYEKMGYAPECVMEYLLTLLNSNFEEWRMQNPDKPYTEFPFSIKKMSNSGCLFDFDKLIDVSKNTVARMTAQQVYDNLCVWAQKYDQEFYKLLSRDEKYAVDILAIGRGGKKPRKDFGIWSEVKDYMGFFYDELFTPDYSYLEDVDKETLKNILETYPNIYDQNDDSNAWFEKLKALADDLGYTSDMKAYRQNPENFKGSVADIAMILRVAITGKQQSPDTYEVIKILGRQRLIERLKAAQNKIL